MIWYNVASQIKPGRSLWWLSCCHRSYTAAALCGTFWLGKRQTKERSTITRWCSLLISWRSRSTITTTSIHAGLWKETATWPLPAITCCRHTTARVRPGAQHWRTTLIKLWCYVCNTITAGCPGALCHCHWCNWTTLNLTDICHILLLLTGTWACNRAMQTAWQRPRHGTHITEVTRWQGLHRAICRHGTVHFHVRFIFLL